MPEVVTVPIEDGSLEAEVYGSGTPSVLVIQTALLVSELAPLSRALAVPGASAAVVHCHRRGYGGSSPVAPGAAMADLVADVHQLIGALGLAPVHVVGASFSSAIALALAASHPRDVHTLTVVEPPPVQGPTVAQFRASAAGMLALFDARGAGEALDDFQHALVGPDWRDWYEAAQPGSVAQMERDAATFFASDVPALLNWETGHSALGRIRCPVLHVGGQATDPWFREAGEVLRRWLPHLEHVMVPGAGHLLATTHTDEAARIIRDFIRRHPLPAAGR